MQEATQRVAVGIIAWTRKNRRRPNRLDSPSRSFQINNYSDGSLLEFTLDGERVEVRANLSDSSFQANIAGDYFTCTFQSETQGNVSGPRRFDIKSVDDRKVQIDNLWVEVG